MTTGFLALCVGLLFGAREERPHLELTCGYADTILDLVDEFDAADSANTLDTRASQAFTCGGVTMPGIFQHPRDDGQARLSYDVSIPPLGDGDRAVFLFSAGLRDGVDFSDDERAADGVLCGVEVDHGLLLEFTVRDSRWRPLSVDLTRFGGTTIRLTLATDADGTSNYDWLVWGEPTVYHLRAAVGKARPGRVIGGVFASVDALARTDVRTFRLDDSEPVDEAGSALAAASRTPLTEAGLYVFAPRVRIQSVASASHLLFAGKDYEVRCTVENVGAAPVEDFHNVKFAIAGAALRRGRADRKLSRLLPGETETVSWLMKGAARRETADVSVSLQSGPDGSTVDERSVTLNFLKAPPQLPGRTTNELRSVVQDDYAMLENEFLRIVFVRLDGRFPYGLLFAQKGPHLEQVATTAPISHLVYRDGSGARHEMALDPTDVTMGGTSAGDATLFFTGSYEDADSIEWRFDANFTLYEGSKRVIVDYHVRAAADRDLLHFAGPTLRVGDGGRGAKKEFALLPGLEMLEGDEESSSSRDAAPPLHNRLAPHPYKVTIPAMGVQQNGITTGLLWDPLLPWGDEAAGVSPLFDSPNRLHGENNHLVGVFLPTVPDWTPENELDATTPYRIDREGLRLKAQLFTDPQGTIFDIPDMWADAYGHPKLADSPRGDEEVLRLSRDGFMTATWDAENQKSRHCVGWDSLNSPGFATLLWYDYLASEDRAVRERVDLIVAKTLEDEGPGGLASAANCHILRWEAPFHFGHLAESMEAARGQVEAVMASQNRDGGWRFRPTDPKQETLGAAGTANVGTCARNALTILKFARVTGDDRALRAGLRALKFMNGFSVPRGSQAWECPIDEPDILAAGYAVGAYLEAFEITSDAAYRARAEYWAKTGLPFLYFWNLPDRPGMRFGSVPVFGTTFRTHSWFGVPVQWNGLVYAYYVQRLSEFTDYPWRGIAEGIVVSALHQQWTEGELRGSYPDGYYGFCTEGKGPHLNPEDIMVNLFALRGHDPDITTVIARRNGARLHVSAGGRLGGLSAGPDAVEFDVTAFPNQDANVLIGNINAVTGVTIDGRPLPRLENLSEGPEGWAQAEGATYATIRARHQSDGIRVVATLGAALEPVAERDGDECDGDDSDE